MRHNDTIVMSCQAPTDVGVASEPLSYPPGVPTPTTSPPVQVFGYEDSQPTRAALRFFRERRVPIHFVDLKRRPIAPGELRRFVERFGAEALLDREGRAYRAANLGYLRLDADQIVERLLADPRLLRLPLVRQGSRVTAGPAEATWKEWLAASAST
jgi:arsenate reductase